MAISGAIAIADSTSAAMDQARLPLSASRASLRRNETVSEGWPPAVCCSALASDPVLRTGAAGQKRGDNLRGESLIRLLQYIRKGVGRVNHRLDEV